MNNLYFRSIYAVFVFCFLLSHSGFAICVKTERNTNWLCCSDAPKDCAPVTGEPACNTGSQLGTMYECSHDLDAIIEKAKQVICVNEALGSKGSDCHSNLVTTPRAKPGRK